MTQGHLLAAVAMIAVLLLLLIILAVRHYKILHENRMLFHKLLTATQRFQKFKSSILESNETLQLQLEAAEIKWADVTNQLNAEKKVSKLYIEAYKKLELTHVDLYKKFEEVMGHYQRILQEKKQHDDMPT